MKFSLFTFILFSAVTWVSAQGLVWNDSSYSDSPKTSFSNDGAKGEAPILKNKFKVDLKPYCPTVREQGKISSCVGWSVGYAAMTIEKAVANKWANDQKAIDENAFSAMFIYNQIKLGDCNFGAELNNAFTFLKEKGNVLYRDFASDANCDSIPFERLRERARLNRVNEFATLFSPDDKADVKIERTKITLANQKPVVIGMVVLDNFVAMKSTDRMWYPSIGKTNLFGGHAMVVIGYDDGLQAFEVMNSWGKGWANEGFAWIRYDDFAKYCKYAYQLILEKSNTTQLAGNIRVLKPVVKTLRKGENNVVFSKLPFEYKNNRFALKNEGVKLPLQFQLVADDMNKGSYLYIISFDNKMKPTVHWPHDESLNGDFVAESQSAVIPGTDFEVTVPGKYNVFSIGEPGTEYLCILNSTTQIKNLPDRLRQIANANGDIVDRIRGAFNNKIISDVTTNYDNDEISYYASGKKEGIIPIVLSFETK